LIFFHRHFHILGKKKNSGFVSKLGFQDIIRVYENSSFVEEFVVPKLNKSIIRPSIK